MTTRRGLLLGLAALPAAAAPPPGNRLAFQVARNGSVIGSHVLEFTPRPDGLEVAIAVDIVVRFGPIALFRYRLRGTESWRDGQVMQASATTDNDGSAAFMRAERRPAGLWVSGSAGAPYLAPAEALPATHWNPAELDGPWINPQDGKLLRPGVARFGAEPLPDGRLTDARRYALSGEVQMELWYSAARQWCALRAPGKDGSTITYTLA